MTSSVGKWGVRGYMLLLASVSVFLLARTVISLEISYFVPGLLVQSAAVALLLIQPLAGRQTLSRALFGVSCGLTLIGIVAQLAVGHFASWPGEVLFLLWVPAVWLIDARMAVTIKRYCTFLCYLFAIALMLGFAIDGLDLGLIFGLPLLNSRSIFDLLAIAILFSVLGLRLQALRRNDDIDDGDRKARSINTVGIANLILIAFITGLASFALLKVQVEKALYQRLRLTMVYRSLTLHNAIQNAYQDVMPLSYSVEVKSLLQQLQQQPGDAEVQASLLRQVENTLSFTPGRVSFLDKNGAPLLGRSDTAPEQILWVDYRDKADIHVIWHERQPFLNLHLKLYLADGTPLGTAVVQMPSPVLAQLLSDNFDLGDSGEMLVCAMQVPAARCVQSRHQKGLYRADPNTELGQLVQESLEAESTRPVLTQDSTGRAVMLVYGPVGPYGMVLRVPPKGLSMLIKMDVTELYAPIRQQLVYVLPVLALIILFGGVVLRHMIKPLIRALRREEARFRELTTLSSDGYWAMDADLRFVDVRGEALGQLGIHPEHWLGRTLAETPVQFEYATARQQLELALANRHVFYEVTLCLPRARDGQPAFVDLSGTPQFDDNGNFTGYRGVAKDITLRKLAENSSIEAQITLENRVEERTAELEATVRFLAHEIEERSQAEERFRSLTELSSDWYWEQDANFRFTQIVGEMYRKGGFPVQESVGHCLWELEWADDPANDWDGLRSKLETGHDFHDFTFRARDFSGNFHYVSISGHPVMKDGMLTGYRGIGKDVSEKQRSEDQVRFLAHYDALTKLPNRVLLGEHVRLALDRARRNGGHVALLFVDLDRFKIINDSLGHGAGDKVLLEVAQRLSRCVRDSDLVARLGGDEFVILLDSVHDGAHVRYTARRMLEGIREPIVLAGDNYQVGASIGVSVFPEDGDNLSDLLKNADAAMYRAKESGRNGIFFYSDSVDELALYGKRMDADLVLALQREQFILHFQTQYDVRERRISGVEALLRWRHPQHGMLSPAAFIPAAEESGLIIELGNWVLRQALATLQRWDQEGLAGMTMAVNLSPNQLRDEFPVMLNALLHEFNIEPQRLRLELPESLMLKCRGRELSLLDHLRAHGVRIVLDNYGAKGGTPLKVDTLKVDRSYIDGVPRALNKVAVIRAAIRTANQHDMVVLAEGVETREQYQWLLDEGCHGMQGFFLSHPMPAERLADFVRQQRSEAGDPEPGVAASGS